MRASDQWVVDRELANDPGSSATTLPTCPCPAEPSSTASGSAHDLRLPVTDPEDGRCWGTSRTQPPHDVAAAVSGVQESLSTEEWPLWARSECPRTRRRGCSAQGAARFAHLIAVRGRARPSARPSARWPAVWRRCGSPPRPVRTSTGRRSRSRPAGTGGTGSAGSPASRSASSPRSPPFNDPLNLVAHKLGPALIAGNGVVLKPSDHTPLTALAFVELLLAAGVPAGRVAVVCGRAQAGQALVTDPRIALVSFTGGPTHRREDHRRRRSAEDADGARREQPDDRLRGRRAARRRRRRSSTARSVWPDRTASRSSASTFTHRSTTSSSREIVAKTSRLKVGSKQLPDTDIGPLISESEAQRVEEWVGKAVARRSRRCTPAASGDGAFYEPTVLTDVPDGAQVLTDEVFGPVVTIIPFDDLVERRSRRRTAATTPCRPESSPSRSRPPSPSPHSWSPGPSSSTAPAISAVDSMPFGGFKNSGIGREGVQFAVEAMTEPKSTIVNLVS